MTDTTNEANVSQPETVSIDTLDQFVRALHAWHSNRVQILQHLTSIPVGTEVSGDDQVNRILEGDFREGFILGLKVALSELGELPFEVEVEYVEDALMAVDTSTVPH